MRTSEPVMLTPSRALAGIIALAVLVGVALGALIFMPPFPQKLAYHAFHDDRPWIGIPNALNVISNLPFSVIGLLGLMHLRQATETTVPDALRSAYITLFAGIFLTGFGSAYYHWAPDNRTLVWDRLPITVAFMGLFAAVIGERIDLALGRRMLVPLVVVGLLSVVYWAVRDDLRPYGIVQFYPVLAIPVMVWAFPARYSHGVALPIAIGFYMAAKVLEDADGPIYAVGHLLSGHTLKHCAAAVGAYWIYRMLVMRRPI